MAATKQPPPKSRKGWAIFIPNGYPMGDVYDTRTEITDGREWRRKGKTHDLRAFPVAIVPLRGVDHPNITTLITEAVADEGGAREIDIAQARQFSRCLLVRLGRLPIEQQLAVIRYYCTDDVAIDEELKGRLDEHFDGEVG